MFLQIRIYQASFCLSIDFQSLNPLGLGIMFSLRHPSTFNVQVVALGDLNPTSEGIWPAFCWNRLVTPDARNQKDLKRKDFQI
tara:strand:- start:261 stop:509 length:249 start_codon:yes stop_codon:yes gene_type:complete